MRKWPSRDSVNRWDHIFTYDRTNSSIATVSVANLFKTIEAAASGVGPQGPAGAAGPQGVAGAAGAAGAQGIQGSQGLQGLPGSDGAQGPQGIQGATGADGPMGPQGLVGPAGPEGPQGIQGLPGVGGVTSVGLSAPAGLSVANSPITSAGTIALSYAAGYSIPLDASQSNWNTAFGWGNHASAGYLASLAIGATVQPFNASTVVDGGYVHTDNNFTTAQLTKLNGVATGATVNLPDSVLLGRGNHTGTQAQSTILFLSTDLAAKAPLASPTFTGTVNLPAGQVVNGVTLTNAGGTTNFLRADGTYAAPAGGGGGGSSPVLSWAI